MIGCTLMMTNNLSFGAFVPRNTEIKDGKLISNNNIYSTGFNTFAGCSGYTRHKTENQKLIIQTPINYYHPKYRSEKEFKKWEIEMELMGGNAKYIGIMNFLGNQKITFESHNIYLLKMYKHNRYLSPEIFMKTDEWVTWEIDAAAYNDSIATYHSFLLLRYLWSWHYVRLVDFYYDIKKKLSITKPDPFDILQMSFYSFDIEKYSQQNYYYGGYGHIILPVKNVRKPLPLKVFMDIIRGKNNINGVFDTQPLLDLTREEAYDLLKNKKYKKFYDRFKG